MKKTNKTLKEFLSQCPHPVLFRKVWKQSKLKFNDVKRWPANYANVEHGGVSGFIYYSDTVTFSQKNIVSIIEVANFDGIDISHILKEAQDDETIFYNSLSWFAWGLFFHYLLNYLES